jgi:hypothetical protein
LQSTRKSYSGPLCDALATEKLSYPYGHDVTAFGAGGAPVPRVAFRGLALVTQRKEALMASISEIERAKMVTSLAGAIGKEEANVLATALNLDGQLATRDELRVMEMALRSDMQDMKDELKDHFRSELKSEIGFLRSEFTSEIGSLRSELKSEIGSLRNDMKTENGSLRSELRLEIAALRTEFTTEVRKQTRQLFVALITVVATIFGLIAGLLGLTGKL